MDTSQARIPRADTDHGATPLDELKLDEVLAGSLLEQVPDGLMVTDEHGRIRLVNSGLEEMFGYDRAELLGEHVELLVPESARAPHRAHRLRYRASPHRRPMGAGLQLEGRRKDGSTFPVDVSLNPIRLGDEVHTIATVRDISERKAAERRSQWVQRLLDSTSDAIYVFDRNTLALLHVNEGACRQTGYSREQLETMTPLHVLPDLPERELRQLLAPLMTDDATDGAPKTIGFETRVRQANGTDLFVEMVCELVQPFPDSEPVFVASARDITERLENQRALAETRERLALAEDRERIARDLHDKVIQRLFATGLGLQSVAGRADAGPVRDRIHGAIDDLDQAIREIRTSIFALHRPSPSSETSVR
ncbi:MAG TPA: PAS domain S-box protein, partial [Acidimicrobiales bacterium]